MSADVDPLATAAIVVALLIASLSIGLAVGLLKRRRWAWFATLMLEGINVVAMLIGLATQGLGAVASYGVMGMVVAFTVFYYLTRPHVAAAFRRHPPNPDPARRPACYLTLPAVMPSTIWRLNTT